MKTKLTACLVTEATKNQLVELRGEFELTEKQLMDLIVRQALRRKKELTELVTKFHAESDELKAQRKQERLAKYKQNAAQKRKEKSAEKLRAKLALIEQDAGHETSDAEATETIGE